jgi:hypothetical protein
VTRSSSLTSATVSSFRTVRSVVCIDERSRSFSDRRQNQPSSDRAALSLRFSLEGRAYEAGFAPRSSRESSASCRRPKVFEYGVGQQNAEQAEERGEDCDKDSE